MGSSPSAVKATLASLALAQPVPIGRVAHYRDQNTIIWPLRHHHLDRGCIQCILHLKGRLCSILGNLPVLVLSVVSQKHEKWDQSTWCAILACMGSLVHGLHHPDPSRLGLQFHSYPGVAQSIPKIGLAGRSRQRAGKG